MCHFSKFDKNFELNRFVVNFRKNGKFNVCQIFEIWQNFQISAKSILRQVLKKMQS